MENGIKGGAPLYPVRVEGSSRDEALSKEELLLGQRLAEGDTALDLRSDGGALEG